MIYFDHAATTLIDKNLIPEITRLLEKKLANPSSSHTLGKDESNFINNSRAIIARLFGARSEEIYFVNSATTAANILLQGYCNFIKIAEKNKNEIIISEIEHPAIYRTAEFLRSNGFRVHFAKVDSNGLIDNEYLQTLLNEKTAIVAIMSVNNEVGVMQNIPLLSRKVKEFNKDIFFISDFVQGIGKIPLENIQDVDAWFIAGHKIGAPIGVACFYLNSRFKINPILFGGGQELGLVPGTSDVVLATILAKCIANAVESFEEHHEKYKMLREYLLLKLALHKINYKLIIPESYSIPSIISIDFLSIKANHLAAALEKENIFISTRSACSSFCSEDSHVIRALQIRKKQKISPVRISFSYLNDKNEIDIFVKALYGILNGN